MQEKKSYIHLYEGNGKGKTSAAVGAAVRMAGTGKKVLFCQFLKGGDSSELAILRRIPEIEVLEVEKSFGFTFRMTEEARREAEAYYRCHWKKAVAKAGAQQVGMLVLDEFVDAFRQGFVEREEALSYLRGEHDCEIILTGHHPPEELVALADYHTLFEMKKHPYEQGVAARRGIEF